MALAIGTAVKETFTIASKNIPSIFAAALLWLVTLWVPYINVGTTIALLYGMPIELSKGKVMNPLAIFDGKYRKYMGEIFSIIGMMMLSLIPAFIFMVVPAIIISIGWSVAVLLLIDKGLNPAEALTRSTQYTYGNKWAIFLSALAVYVVFFVVSLIVSAITSAIDVDFITYIFYMIIAAFGATLGVSFNGMIYRYLVRERTDVPEIPA